MRKESECMAYSFSGRVRYSEIGENGLLTLPGILNYFQDCSTFQSEEVGLGIDDSYAPSIKRILFSNTGSSNAKSVLFSNAL